MLLASIFLPLLGGACLPLFRFRSRRARSLYTGLITLLTSCLVWAQILGGARPEIRLLQMTDALSIVFRMDRLSVVFAGLIAFLWPIAVLYAHEYMAHEERESSFFAWYTMSYGVTLAVACAENYFTLYVFYELLTLVTMPLVLHKKDARSVHAARKYLYYSITGAALGFIGLIFLLTYGRVDFLPGGTLTPEAVSGLEALLRLVFVLSFVGFGTKAALFPMHAWLPMASVAPTPVTALLHAVAVVKAGAFAVIRLIDYSFGTWLLEGTWAQTVCLLLASFTIVYGSVMAVREQHLKRRLAYSTVSNLSYILMGAALMTNAGLTGALTHLVFHALMKITLFYCAGAILVRTNREYVQEMRGLARVMPFTCAVFTFASLALTGVPPLLGFASKWNLATAAIDSGLIAGYVGAGALIVSAVLTAVYLLSVVVPMYTRPLEGTLPAEKCDPGLPMKLSLGVLCLAMLVMSFSAANVTEWLSHIL